MVYYLGANLTWFGRELAGYSKGNKAIAYQYDVDGMRYRKVVKENDSVKATYDYVYSDGTLILLTHTTNRKNKSLVGLLESKKLKSVFVIKIRSDAK